uniref:ATP synthase F0 subunit 8 n=1 Tax=Plectus sambesii TaxID=2011161 RepID=A0A914VT05_9BILA
MSDIAFLFFFVFIAVVCLICLIHCARHVDGRRRLHEWTMRSSIMSRARRAPSAAPPTTITTVSIIHPPTQPPAPPYPTQPTQLSPAYWNSATDYGLPPPYEEAIKSSRPPPQFS